MDSLVWPIAHLAALYAQLVFLVHIGYNLTRIYLGKKLEKHLSFWAVLAYAIYLVTCATFIFLLWNQSQLDRPTQLSSFRIFGVGSTLLGLALMIYSSSAKKKLLTL